jgi:hypothetical protein
MALSDSGCLKSSCSVDIAMPPQLCLSFLNLCSTFFFKKVLAAKLIGKEQQVDEQQSSHQVEAAFKECMLKIEFVSGLV